MFEFNYQGMSIGEPDEEYGEEAEDANRMKLADYLEEDCKLLYTYDFGDYWEHEIIVEKILQPEDGATYPRCIRGKRNSPPEDVGGVPGYYDFLRVLANPNDPEYKEMIEWAGGNFDPEEFDVESINEALKHWQK